MQTKEKIAAQRKTFREANREKIAAYSKAYRAANREKYAAYNKTHREANREKYAAKKKIYAAANREKIAAYMKVYRFENHEQVKASGRIYKAAHPDEHLAYKHKCRAKEAGVKIGDEKAILAWIKSWKTSAPVACHYCSSIAPGTDMTVDHVVPISAGGPHDLYNLVVCCLSCNSSKQNKLPAEWLAKTG